MPGISAVKIGLPFSKKGFNFVQYWTTREPSALALTVISDTQIDATWTDAADEADGLKLYYSSDGGVNYTLGDTVAFGDQAGSITGLTAGVQYTIKLVAYKGTNESTGVTETAITIWYLTTGVAAEDVVAAYQFVNQPDEATSLLNLVNPAIHALTKNGSPTWNTAIGWKGNGAGDLRSDIKPASSYTIIIKFKNAQGGVAYLFGENRGQTGVAPGYSSFENPSVYFGANNQPGKYKGITNGTFALCGQKCYINGVDAGVTIGAWSVDPSDVNLSILARRLLNGNSYQFSRASVEDLVVYNKTLTPTQVAAINVNLENHYPSSAKNLNYTVESSKLLTSATTEWFGRPSMVVRENVTILVYREGLAHTGIDGEFHIRFSSNRGDTWSDEDKDLNGDAVTGFPMTLDDGHSGESFLMLAPNGDLILHAWWNDDPNTENGTWQSISEDGGLTWTTPAKLDIGNTTADDLIHATDDYFVYDGVMYCGARQWDKVDPTKGAAILLKSEDNGATWTYLSTIASNSTGDGGKGVSEVGIEYLGNNRIIAIMREYTEYGSLQVYSTDMGATWGTPYNAGIAISGRHRIWTRKHLMEEANWWTDTTLIMTGFLHGRWAVLWQSNDAGLTWSNAFKMQTASMGDAGYNSLVKYDDDTIVLMTYTGTNDAANIKQFNVKIL